jgi:N12 class adenine-specific DNA methylase/antitoxin (DNA-binding transcriptional repressor) of toxin-antitoxin stability system
MPQNYTLVPVDFDPFAGMRADPGSYKTVADLRERAKLSPEDAALDQAESVSVESKTDLEQELARRDLNQKQRGILQAEYEDKFGAQRTAFAPAVNTPGPASGEKAGYRLVPVDFNPFANAANEGALDLSPEAIAARKAEPGNFMRGVKTGWGQFAPTMEGAVGLAGATAEKAFGEGGYSTQLKNWGLNGFQQGMEKLQPLQHENDDVTKAWGKAVNGDPGAMVDFVTYAFGYGMAQMAQTAAVGVASGLVGGALSGGAGAAPAAVAGMVEQTAAKGFIKSLVEREIAKRVAAGATVGAATKSLATDIGAVTGLTGMNVAQEAGQIYPAAEEQATKAGTPLTGSDIARVWGAATVAGASETVPDVIGLGALAGRFKGITDKLGATRAGRAATGALAGGGLEAGQEAFQTAVEHYGAGQPIADDEGLRDIINSAAMAVVPGVAFGGGFGLLSKRIPKPAPSQEEITQKAVADISAAPDLDTAIQAAADATKGPIVPALIPIVPPKRETPPGMDTFGGLMEDKTPLNAEDEALKRLQIDQAHEERAAPTAMGSAMQAALTKQDQRDVTGMTDKELDLAGRLTRSDARRAEIAGEQQRRQEVQGAKAVRGDTQQAGQGSEGGQPGLQFGAVEGGGNLQQPAQGPANVGGAPGGGTQTPRPDNVALNRALNAVIRRQPVAKDITPYLLNAGLATTRDDGTLKLTNAGFRTRQQTSRAIAPAPAPGLAQQPGGQNGQRQGQQEAPETEVLAPPSPAAGAAAPVAAPTLADLHALAESKGIDVDTPEFRAWTKRATGKEHLDALNPTKRKILFERLKARPAAAGTAPEWVAFPPESGTLGVPRADMPQIKAEHRGAMVNFLEARGVTHHQEEVRADSLKPTQAEYSPAKVEKAQKFEGGDRSILVSSDNHIVDGHHQAIASARAGEPINIIRLNAPIAKLLPLVREFPSATTAPAGTAAPAAKAAVAPAPQAKAETPPTIPRGTAAPAETKAPIPETPAPKPETKPASEPKASDILSMSGAEFDALIDEVVAERRAAAAEPAPAKTAGASPEDWTNAIRAAQPQADRGALAYVEDVRSRMKDQFPTKEAFDAAFLAALQAHPDLFQAQTHAWSGRLSDAEKAQLVPNGRGGWFDAIGLRQQAAPTKAAIIPTRAGIVVQPLDEKGEPSGPAHKAGEKPAGAAPTSREQLIADLKAKGFDGTIDRLNRGTITEAQARDELTGKPKPGEFKRGQRVEYVSGKYEGRHGEIAEAHAFRWSTGFGQVSESQMSYEVKTDNGGTVHASQDEIRAETGKPERVVADVKVGDRWTDPEHAYSMIGYYERGAAGDRAASSRAKKPDMKAKWLRNAEVKDADAARYRDAYNEWATRFPDEAAKIAPPVAAAQTAPTSVPSAAGAPSMTLTQTKHTKSGADLWVVKLGERVDAGTFSALKAKAARNHGIWSNFTKGFNFTTPMGAEAFMGKPATPAEGPSIERGDVARDFLAGGRGAVLPEQPIAPVWNRGDKVIYHPSGGLSPIHAEITRVTRDNDGTERVELSTGHKGIAADSKSLTPESAKRPVTPQAPPLAGMTPLGAKPYAGTNWQPVGRNMSPGAAMSILTTGTRVRNHSGAEGTIQEWEKGDGDSVRVLFDGNKNVFLYDGRELDFDPRGAASPIKTAAQIASEAAAGRKVLEDLFGRKDSAQVAAAPAVPVAASLDIVLTDADKAEAADALGDKAWSDGTAKKFLQGYAEWLQQGAKELATVLGKLYAKVLAAARAGLLSIAVAFNFNAAQHIPSLSMPVTQQTITQAVDRPKADFKGVAAGTEARTVADWVVRNDRQKGDPFIIADKAGGLIYAFDANGALLAKTPALFGKAKGDVLTERQAALSVAQTTEADKITPAGQFSGQLGLTDSGTALVFQRQKQSVLAIHRVYLGTPSERRMERLQSETPDDNRISYGCINALPEFIDNILVPHFTGKSQVFVLPETATAKAFFGINDPLTIGHTLTVTGPSQSAQAVSWGEDKYAVREQRAPAGRFASRAKGDFDDEIWAKVRPALDADFAEFSATDGTAKDYVRQALATYNESIIPYLRRWHEESAHAATGPGKPESAGTSPLEGVLPEEIPRPEGGGATGAGPRLGGGAHAPGDTGGPGGGLHPVPGVGEGAGTVPAAPGGRRPAGGTAGQSGLQQPGGNEPGARPGELVPQAENFVITDELELGKGTSIQKYEGNVAAIRLLKTLEAENRDATPEEQKTLARYVGWGGIKEAFPNPNNPARKGWERRVAEIKDLLTEDEHDAAARSIQDAHYTSKPVVDIMWAIAGRLGFDGGKVLENSMGVGNFFGLMPAQLRTGATLTGIELDNITARIAKQLYPKANIIGPIGFEDVNLADNTFNLNVGNPPFGKGTPYDANSKHLNGFTTHNFFFAKAIDKLAPGGLHIQVVSRYLMDAQTNPAREYIAHRAELIGAMRLPWTAFYSTAGTEVVTDIIVLQKLEERDWGRADDSWTKTTMIPDPLGGEPMRVNQYYADHPEMIVGQMNRSGEMVMENDITVQPEDGIPLELGLMQRAMNFPDDIYRRGKSEADVKAESDAAVSAPAETIEQHAIGSYFEEGGRLLQRVMTPDGSLRAEEITAASIWKDVKPGVTTKKGELKTPSTWGETRIARVRGMVRIHEAEMNLLNAEKNDAPDAELKQLRAVLNKVYDKYVAEHGFLNQRENELAFRADSVGSPRLLALEHNFDAGVSKSAAKRLGIKEKAPTAEKMPIFTTRQVAPYKAPDKAANAIDGLAISIMEKGSVSVPYIAKLTGMGEHDIVRDLTSGEKPVAYFNPASKTYETAPMYLSGNVKRKYQEAREAGLMEQAEALKAAFPPDAKAGDIVARMGAGWIHRDVYAKFVRHLLGEEAVAEIIFLPATGGFAVSTHGGDEVMVGTKWGSPRRDAHDLISRILNNKDMAVYDTDSDGKREMNKAATEAAQEKAEQIREEFMDWVFKDSDQREALVSFYNENINTHVGREWDGDYLTLPGKVPDAIITLNRHQLNAVARWISTGKILLDHVVGSGKTYTIIAATMEMRRIGLLKKPMIVVPNHLVEQWAQAFYQLYPGANILAMRKADFTKQNRNKMLARVATGNWDAVIFSHSSFGFIANERGILVAAIRDQIAELQAAIDAARKTEGAKSRTAAQYQKSKEKMQQRMKALLDKPKDETLTFQQLGVDQITVDESQEFKNLFFTTQRRGVGGFGNPTGSKRAFDMYIKTQWLQKTQNGRGVAFATGTPISNSLTELFTLQRYLGLDELKARGMVSLDAWLAAFGITETDYESNVTGTKYKRKERLRRITNAPEIMQLYKQFTDSVTQADVERNYREDHEGKAFPIPKVKGGKARQNVTAKATAAQNAFSEQLNNRMDHLPSDPRIDNALKVLTDGRKASLDMRLIDPSQSDEPGSKIHVAADNIYRIYAENTHRLGTQLVFCDLSTPNKHGKKDAAKFLKEAREILDDKGAAPFGDLRQQWRELRSRIQEMYDTMDEAEGDQRSIDHIEKFLAQHDDIDAAVTNADLNFSIYDDMRTKLIERGIAPHEIAFIHDYNGDAQKQDLFDAVNAGRIRVLLGSTAKMGAGTNVQRRMVGLHHLDVPWRPSDILQREGRIVRQGNYFRYNPITREDNPGFEVEILAYATEPSSDVFMWQAQEQKLVAIESISRYHGEREIEDVSGESMSASEMKALASGNPLILEDVKLTEEIRKLEASRARHRSTEQDLESEVARYQRYIDQLPAVIARQQELSNRIDAYKADPFEGKRPTAQIDGKEVNAEQAWEHIAEVRNAALMAAAEANAPARARQAEISELAKPLKEKSDEYKALAAEHKAIEAVLVKPKFEVTFAGKLYRGVESAQKAVTDKLGDHDAIRFVLDGKDYIRRADIEAHIDDVVRDWSSNMEGSATLGTVGGIPIELSWINDRLGNGIKVTIGGEVEYAEHGTKKSFIGQPYEVKADGDMVLRLIQKILRETKSNLTGNKESYQKALKGIAPLKAQMGKPWGKDADLAKKKARAADVRRELAGQAPPVLDATKPVGHTILGTPIYIGDIVRMKTETIDGTKVGGETFTVTGATWEGSKRNERYIQGQDTRNTTTSYSYHVENVAEVIPGDRPGVTQESADAAGMGLSRRAAAPAPMSDANLLKFRAIRMGEGFQLVPSFSDVQLAAAPGFDFFAHRRDDKNRTWNISERSTGLHFGAVGDTKKEAIAEAERIIGEVGVEKLQSAIDKAPKITPEILRRLVPGAGESGTAAQIQRSGLLNQPNESALLDPSKAEAAKVQAGIEGKTVLEAARFIAATGTGFQKIIAGKIVQAIDRLQTAGVVFDLKLAHVGDTVPRALLPARGITAWNFAPNNNTVTVWINASDVTGKVGTSYETVLHELVHAATVAITHLGNRKAAIGYKSAQDVRDLYAVTNHVIAHFNARVAAAKAGKTTLTDFEDRLRRGASNAFTNPDETLAWALSNPQAQAYLETIPYPEHKSAWTAFVDAIRKLLGIPRHAATAFSEVLRISENLMGDNANELLGIASDQGSTEVQTRAGSGVLQQAKFIGKFPNIDSNPRTVSEMKARATKHAAERATVTAFKRWFGASVVTEDGNAGGKPLEVYHGTTADIAAYDPARLGSNTRHPTSRLGFWFTTSPEVASLFTEQVDESVWPPKMQQRAGANVMPVYLAITNPYVMSVAKFREINGRPFGEEFERDQPLAFEKTRQWIDANKASLLAKGYDGIKVEGDPKYAESLGGEEYAADAWVAFQPEQIKSVFNRGTFDPSDSGILAHRSTASERVFETVQKAPVVGNWLSAQFNSPASFGILKPFNTQLHKALTLAKQGKPEFKRVFDKLQDFLSDTTALAVHAEQQAPTMFRELTGLGAKSVKNYLGAAKTEDINAIGPWLNYGTLYGGPSPMDGIVWTDKELAGDFAGSKRVKPRVPPLIPEQIKLYHEARAAINTSVETGAKSAIFKNVEKFGITFDKFDSLDRVAAEVKDQLTELRNDAHIRYQQQEDVTNTAHEESQTAGDAAKARPKDRQLRVAAENARANYENEQKALDDIQKDIDTFDRLIGTKDEPGTIDQIGDVAHGLIEHGYAPLKRFGNRTVAAYDSAGKTRFFGAFDGTPLVPGSANAEMQRVAMQIKALHPEWDVVTGVRDEEAWKMYQGLSLDALENFLDLLPAETQAEIKRDPIVQEYLKNSVNNRSVLKELIHRKGTPGFSTDVARVVASFMTSHARAASSLYHIGAAKNMVQDIPQEQGDVRDEAAKLVDYVTKPGEEAAKLRGFLFFHFLGASVAAGAVNLTQTPMMTVGYLNKFASLKDVTARILSASAKAVMDPIGIKGALGQALVRAEREGITAPQQIHHLIGISANNPFSSNRAFRGFMNVWGSIFGATEVFNRRVAFMAGYETGQANGMGDAAAYAFAKDVVAQTQGLYNRGNTANIGRGAIGKTVFTFKQFTVMYLELLQRLPPKQQLLMLGILLAAAGGEGLPFAEDIEDLVDTLGQWLGFSTNTGKWTGKVIRDTLGAEFERPLLKGLGGMLPIDLHSRLGFGNIVPGTAFLKPSEIDKTRDVAEAVGPLGGVLKSFSDSLQLLARGKWDQAAVNAAPKALRDAYNGLHMAATGESQDIQGRLALKDVTAGEALGKAIGFNPQRAAIESETKRELQLDKNLRIVRMDEMASDWADGILRQDRDKQAEARQRLRTWNSENPELRIQMADMLRSVQERVKAARMTGAERFIRSTPKALKPEARSALQ